MDIGKGLQDSLSLYLHNFGRLLLATLIVTIVSGLTFGILAGPLVGGLLLYGLKLLRGEQGDLHEIFGHFDQFVPTFLITLCLWMVMIVISLIGWIPIIGWVLALVVGPAASFLYFIAIGLVINQKKTVSEALRLAVDDCRREPLFIWLYALISFFLAGIGGILFGIGAILTAPFGVAAMVVAYQELDSFRTPDSN